MEESKLIQLKYSSAEGSRPSPEFMSPGEIALNRADGVLYYLHTDGDVRSVRTDEIDLGAIGLISVEDAFPGLTYDSSGGLLLDSTALRNLATYSAEVESSLNFLTLPTSDLLPTEETQFITLKGLNAAVIDMGYF